MSRSVSPPGGLREGYSGALVALACRVGIKYMVLVQPISVVVRIYSKGALSDLLCTVFPGYSAKAGTCTDRYLVYVRGCGYVWLRLPRLDCFDWIRWPACLGT